MSFQFVPVDTLRRTQLSDTVLSTQWTVEERTVGYWRETKHQIEPQLVPPLCLTFQSETRRVSVTWRKRHWLTRLIPCPWRHYKSTLPGHWYLWSDTESDVRSEQIQTDSVRERGCLSYSWESFLHETKASRWLSLSIKTGSGWEDSFPSSV